MSLKRGETANETAAVRESGAAAEAARERVTAREIESEIASSEVTTLGLKDELVAHKH